MAELRTFQVDIPEEPPDMSVVAGPASGKQGAGRAWMRNDPLGHKGPGWWYPAGPYYDDRDELTVQPLRWKVLLAQLGRVTVLRWGDGHVEPGGGT